MPGVFRRAWRPTRRRYVPMGAVAAAVASAPVLRRPPLHVVLRRPWSRAYRPLRRFIPLHSEPLEVPRRIVARPRPRMGVFVRPWHRAYVPRPPVLQTKTPPAPIVPSPGIRRRATNLSLFRKGWHRAYVPRRTAPGGVTAPPTVTSTPVARPRTPARMFYQPWSRAFVPRKWAPGAPTAPPTPSASPIQRRQLPRQFVREWHRCFVPRRWAPRSRTLTVAIPSTTFHRPPIRWPAFLPKWQRAYIPRKWRPRVAAGIATGTAWIAVCDGVLTDVLIRDLDGVPTSNRGAVIRVGGIQKWRAYFDGSSSFIIAQPNVSFRQYQAIDIIYTYEVAGLAPTSWQASAWFRETP